MYWPAGQRTAPSNQTARQAGKKARLRAAPLNTDRDLERERRIFRDALPVYLFALFTVLGLYNRYDLNALSSTKTMKSIPQLGYQAGQTLWIDGRANCFRCRSSVHKGDVVLFSRDGALFLGKLVATPGEIAEVTARSVPGRAPASNTLTVPSGKIAVRSNPEGDLVELIDTGELRGRVLESLGAYLRTRN